MLEVPFLGGIDRPLQADKDLIAAKVRSYSCCRSPFRGDGLNTATQGDDGGIVQFSIEADQRALMAVTHTVDAVGGELSNRLASITELEAVFEHHLVEDVGFVKQRIEGRFLVDDVLPEQSDILLAGVVRIGLKFDAGEVALDQAVDLEAGFVGFLPLFEQPLLLLLGLLLFDAGDDPLVAFDGDVGDFLVTGLLLLRI